MTQRATETCDTVKFYLKNGFKQMESPVVMGILNITPDSFSDGGKFYKNGDALKQVEKMVAEGAGIIDIGGESTRPGAGIVSVDEEIDRILPVIEAVKTRFDILVSVDTYKERVARAAVQEAGADIVNDISALSFSEKMAATVAKLDVPVILMHIKGSPETMQINPQYNDLMSEMIQYIHDRIDYAMSRGIKKEKLIIDPGIGFGKQVGHNIEILQKLKLFKEFELPILVGLSRKSFLGAISGEMNPLEREAETISANIIAYHNGASILRVHQVAPTIKAIKILKKLN